MARSFQAIDTTFSPRPCRLDGVEAHEGPRNISQDNLVDCLISTQVWSAGLAPIKFVEGSSLEKGKGGRIVVDEYLKAADRVFALGDCAASREDPLPPTAVAAEQQGAYLAKCFNTTYYKAGADGPMPAKPDPVRPSAMPFDFLEPLDGLWEASSEFRYVERGKMASMGMWGGVADMTKSEITPVGGTLTGVTAFASWRGAYLSKQVSVQNMILIPMFWFKSWLFGRDISRF